MNNGYQEYTMPERTTANKLQREIFEDISRMKNLALTTKATESLSVNIPLPFITKFLYFTDYYVKSTRPGLNYTIQSFVKLINRAVHLDV